MLNWPGFDDFSTVNTLNSDFFWNKVKWQRLNEKYESATLFGLDPNSMKFAPIQGTFGDCYFLASASAVAVNPERIKQLFVD